ncbi:MAG TPA: glycosyltransferase family 2 protein [Flavisolibacter sp.]|nr:glycosyltransferase family 2 protein [Flavisolibacter sp.]
MDKQYPTGKELVSVVLCTYNGANFLAAQIDSLLRQTYAPLEIIISDDASTDGTLAILQSFENHPGFHIFYQPKNIGYAQNFAFALQRATGEYIALCDQDDVWLPHKVETLLHCMSGQWLAYSDSLLVDAAGNSMHKKLSDLRNMRSGRDTHGFFLFNVVWGHALMIHRNLLPASLPIPDGIPHDIWLAYKASTLTGLNYCPAALTHYRQHQSAVTQTLLPKNIPTRT